ncbi:thiamine phosphate synthase [Paenibacillus puldeungensis]|uniref:Thiamine-phosphate synthase n=1 Tax=Paenibacillus puldeungensis TaxID=696536 RepID=A0ABW3S3X2_9BACL
MSGRISSSRMRGLLETYLVIGSPNCKAEPILVLEEAIAGGVTLVQFREKGEGALHGELMFRLAMQLHEVCRKANIPFIINDDVELALQIGADGVHVGQTDEVADLVRSRIGNMILGVSAYTVVEAEAAIHRGADYLGVGPIFPTASKSDAKAPQGTNIICEMRRKGIDLPLVGIGGITTDSACEVIRAEADGIAVISAITQADNVRGAVKKLKQAVRENR